MKKQIVVIGLGHLGETLAQTLCGIGHEVLALDSDETRVQKVAHCVTQAVQVDPTNETALRELGVGNFDIGIVAIPDIETNVLSTILLKILGVRYVIAQEVSDLHGAILAKIGADKIVSPEREIGTGIAYVLTLGDVIDYIPVSSEYGVVKVSAPSHFIGKSLSELGLGHHGKMEVTVLLLHRKQEIMVSPGGIETIKPEDILVLAGKWDKLEEMFSQMSESNGGR